MAIMSFGEWRPDVSDINGSHTTGLQNVVPRGDGYGPVNALGSFSTDLPLACRGYFHARNTDGTVTVFAATIDRIFRMDNTSLSWVPVSKVTGLTSISNGSPAVFTKNGHALVDNDAIVLSTSGTLPTGLTVGTVYYVINDETNTFNVSLTPGGAAVNTTGAGSGTHSMTYFYSDIPSTDNWQFTQHGNRVIAVQANSAPQSYVLGTDAAFSDLAGSPPNARYITTVGQIVVLAGLVSSPRKLQWSALNDPTNWTTGIANSTDMAAGGVVRGVAGGEFGLVLQESVIRRLNYIPGAELAFQIDTLAEDLGLFGPYSVARASGKVFFYSSKGFYRYDGMVLTPIGKERVDRTFAAELDVANLQLLIAAADPAGTRVFWGYKTNSNSSTTFNKLLCFDDTLDRWTPAEVEGEYLAPIVKPGITLDGLDSVSGSVDALGFSLDSVAAAVSTSLSAFNSDHELGLFDGAALEAVLDSPEQALDDSRRVLVLGLRPISDAEDVRCRIRHRARLKDAISETAESSINDNGICSQRVDTRYARARMRIPAGTAWTYAAGIEPEFKATGTR
jgi:hypothetical protein